MKGGNHYVLDKFMDGSTANTYFTFLKEDSGSSMYYKDEMMLRAFERVSSTITISSATINLNGCVSSTYCFASTEKATIVWKSHLTSFWINKKLTFSNIILDGRDMFPYVKYDKNTQIFSSDSPYRFKKQTCCVCDSEGLCYQDPSFSADSCLCSLKQQQIPVSLFSKQFQEYNSQGSSGFHWEKRPYGLFNLEFLSDYASASKPELIIEVDIKIKPFNNFFFRIVFSKTLNFIFTVQLSSQFPEITRQS